MNLNITLVIQAFNFIVAYYIITKVFLKPGIAKVIKEKAHDKALEDQVAMEQAEKNRYQAYKEKRWHECQRSFKQMFPKLALNNDKLRSYSIAEPAFNDTEIKKAAQKIAGDLKDKIILSKDHNDHRSSV